MKDHPTTWIGLLWVAVHLTAFAGNGPDEPARSAFTEAESGAWEVVFSDTCTGTWKDHWFLDGDVGTATNSPKGMTLTAGPEFKNDAHHMVLWTKDRFEGDLRIDYEYTRLDRENRCVTILYIQATGSGKGPYTKDITRWNALRKIPSMRTYYNHMHTYHLSYAAFGNGGTATESYIRGRRYMPEGKGLKGTELTPEYASKTLFGTGVPHQITVIKRDRDLFLRIENPNETMYGHMTNEKFPIITEGRIGLRHMFTRSACYKNFRVSKR